MRITGVVQRAATEGKLGSQAHDWWKQVYEHKLQENQLEGPTSSPAMAESMSTLADAVWQHSCPSMNASTFVCRKVTHHQTSDVKHVVKSPVHCNASMRNLHACLE